MRLLNKSTKTTTKKFLNKIKIKTFYMNYILGKEDSKIIHLIS